MKQIIKKTILTAIAALFIFTASIAQPPPPPGDHGSGDNQNPFQQALIGSGLAMLFALGAAYAGIKTYNARKRLS